MNDLLLTIIDRFGHIKEIFNPRHIPRVGDGYSWQYGNFLVIRAVSWNDDLTKVTIVLE